MQHTVNNLTIQYSALSVKWQVVSPAGKILEEFVNEKDAIDWAYNTPDFTADEQLLSW